jgi:type IV pilus assembly protein PilQ
VSYDDRTNTLLLHDSPERIKELRNLIAVLDKPVQQVLIESRIVVATDQFTRELGAKFGAQGSRTNPSGQVISTGGTVDSVSNSTGGLNVNLPAATPAGSFGLAILGANYALDLELSAAQTEGRGEVISSPRVITANQQEAVIRQGQQIGYVTYQNSASGAAGSGTATVQFKDAVLELKVTPTITADNRVYLKINVKKDALAKFIDAPGSGQVPQIDTRELNTSVLVDNGQTVVLGGIYEITKQNSVTKVPGLGDIPGIGVLFRKTSRQNDKAELLIFVTPRILSDTLQ